MSDRLDAAVAELVAALREEMAQAPPAAMPDRLLDVVEAATVLGVSRTQAYQEIQAGRLRSLKVGRRRLVPSSAIAEFIAERAA